MTKLLERAIDAVKALPPGRQDEIARELLALVAAPDDGDEIDPADLDAVLAGIADADAGRIATDEEVEAVFSRFRR